MTEPSTPARSLGARDLAVLAAFFLPITVLLQLAMAVQRRMGKGAAELGWQYAWMLPITEGLLYGLAGAVLLLLGLALRRRGGLPVFVGVFALAFLTTMTALIVFYRFATWANLLVSLGVAVRAAQSATARPDRFLRFARRGAVVLCSVMLLLAVGTVAARAIAERRALAALPAAADGAPNVLLLILDTVRAASTSVTGYERPTTPVLEQLARRGVVFERAISTAPWTLPGHTGLLAGHYTSDVSVGWRTPLRADGPFLAEVLRERGYRTGAFVANLVYTTAERGLGPGFIRYEDFVPSLGEFLLTSSVGYYIVSRRNRVPLWRHDRSILNRKTAGELHDDVARWLDDTKPSGKRRPFFAFVNYIDAHVPYFAEPPAEGRFVTGERWGKYTLERNAAGWVDTDGLKGDALQTEQDAYDEAIAYIDHEIGALLAELERQGELANTVVIVSADHGEEFDEHGVLTHALSLYLPSIHVPLVISGPGALVAQGARVSHAVTTRDVPATVLDLAGGSAGTRVPGRSLAFYWRDSATYAASTPSLVLSELRPMPDAPKGAPVAKGQIQSLVVDDRFHYIRYGDGSEELFDIVADPWEKQDLSATPAGQAIVARYRPTFPDLRRTAPEASDTIVRR